MASKETNLIWIDMEMTGLNPESDRVIEIASIATDHELNVLAQGPELIIHQPASVMDQMDAWNKRHHSNSGLWKKVLESQVQLEEAENETLSFIRKYVKKGKGVLAGNSIWQDRRFIIKHMPKIHDFLHYRMVDVTTIKLLFGLWSPGSVYDKKSSSHRALEDITGSIDELRFYRTEIHKLATGAQPIE